jgi:hypothetical protein
VAADCLLGRGHDITKDFVGQNPRTPIALSRKGRRAFQQHLAYPEPTSEGP